MAYQERTSYHDQYSATLVRGLSILRIDFMLDLGER